MSFFNISPILEHMLLSENNINGLRFFVGRPPQVEVNKKLFSVKIRGLRCLTPYQIEIISMALMNRNNSMVEELGKTGLVYGYFNTKNYRTQFRIKLSETGSYSIVMRVLDNKPLTQDENINVFTMAETRFDWADKNLLICVADESRQQSIEKLFNSTKMEVTIPDVATKVIKNMPNILKKEIVLLDTNFDDINQGSIILLKHINTFSSLLRRRIYTVLLSPQVKTLDTYMAFLNCVNLTVNSEDLESLPIIVEKSIKDYNELYCSYSEVAGSLPF